MWNSLMTLKYGQGHHSRITWKLSCDFLLAISVSVDVSYLDIARENDNIGWNDLQMPFNVVPIESSYVSCY